MIKFSEAKQIFDNSIGKDGILTDSLVPVNGRIQSNIIIRNNKRELLEEYYKWQFIYALIHSDLYPKNVIGVEVSFPKGNAKSAPLKLDAAIFDDPSWISHYNEYWKRKRSEDLEWLNAHLLGVIEFKRDDKDIEKVFTNQIKPAMKEKEPGTAYVLGFYYGRERLYIFNRREGFFLRYDEGKNKNGMKSKIGDLSLHIADAYHLIPSFDQLNNRVHSTTEKQYSQRGINDLDIITSIATVQIQTAFSGVLRTLDKCGLVNQRGYEIIIQTFALKIFDEKRNEKTPNKKLQFYITDSEHNFSNLSESEIQQFIKRFKHIYSEAEGQYQKILANQSVDYCNQNHVRAVSAICRAFQDFSFVRSAKSDLYQLVFYNFANSFKRDESAQFLTPIPVIDFLVKIVNPRNGEKVFDPCCGIGDFLSLSYVNSQSKDDAWHLDDANIYGVDLDKNMIMLATLNMLLNGDGEAKLFCQPDKGSILSKIAIGSPPQLVELIPSIHNKGNWNNWLDGTKLMKFEVVLTNPPFGEDRAYRPVTNFDREVIEMYETWEISGGDNIDLGIVFLENAYRCLKDEGRLGIVLSNSIASINRWREIRKWLIDKMRIVALFDLPSNVFAETGVNTTLLVAYKPKAEELESLNKEGYSVFVRDIQKVGYEKRTSKRNVFFNPVYRIDEKTFDTMIDSEGVLILDEEFSQTLLEFRNWSITQESTLQRLFLTES